MRPVKNIIVVGGGTAGWIAASVLSAGLPKNSVKVTVVESKEIGTVGVGEATIPPIRELNALLSLNEDEIIRRANGTFKLGIEFVNWGAIGDRYFHPFGEIGHDIGGVPFHHHWLRTRDGAFLDYALTNVAASAGRFGRPWDYPRSILSKMVHALHFDASLYAELLREISLKNGVEHIDARIEGVSIESETGFVDELQLSDGRKLKADLYIDCSGFKGLLIEEALKTGYEDWSHWLPMDRAIAVQSEVAGPTLPYTRATAGASGWRWRIPLRTRTGNGHVYCSHFIGDDDAEAELISNLDASTITTPRRLRFTTGRRLLSWNKNVIALGLSSGFLEPLESTSIHLVQRGIANFVQMFPVTGIIPEAVDIYNRKMAAEYESIRDFVILHYKLTQRDDSPFWQYVRNMSVPDSLTEKMALFSHAGHVALGPYDLFKTESWVSVLFGQGLVPNGHAIQTGIVPEVDAREALRTMRRLVQEGVQNLPTHDAYLASICAK